MPRSPTPAAFAPVTLALSLALAAPAALADTVEVPSTVTAATLYPQGAAITRNASFDLPPGEHSLVLSGMPRIDLDSLRISAAPGLRVGTISYRDEAVPPGTPTESPAIEAARARVEEVEDRIRAVEDAAREAELRAGAARDRIGFLGRLGGSEAAGAADPERLRALLDLVGQEGLAARRDARAAELEARSIRDDKTALDEELTRARAALDALLTEAPEDSVLVIDVTAEAPAAGDLTLGYVSADASWQPAYDIRLRTGEAPGLTVIRRARLAQSTGEDWQDVAVTLSTARPQGRIAPGSLPPRRLRIEDPARPIPLSRSADRALLDAPASEAMGAKVMVETATASSDGIVVSYAAPAPVTIANGADRVQVELGRLSLDPEIHARAVPMLDPTAYLVATFVNDSGELLLPGTAQVFRDGSFAGRTRLDLLPAGEKAEWAFGPIDGLRLSRRVDDRMEGDRGMLGRSSERRESVTIRAENRTDRAWDLRLLDRVPYSEQEDLRISWKADPMPDRQDFDDRRGVLEWQLPLAAGQDAEITLEHEITWPEDKILR